MKIQTLLVLAISLLSAHNVNASTVSEVELKCPVGGKSFKTILAMSGTQFGQNLDLKPYGPIISPWPVAKCPENGFVIYKNDFTKQELASITEYVLSNEYQSLQKVESNYYLIATLMKKQKSSNASIAFALLKATWEVESDKRYAKYAAETLAAFESVIANPPSDLKPQGVLQHRQIAGEMERRLGNFSAAQKRFTDLLNNKTIRGTILEKVVGQELKLIAARDSSSQPFK